MAEGSIPLEKNPDESQSENGSAELKTMRVVLAGRSAAGKSTLMRTLFGFQEMKGKMGASRGTKESKTMENTINEVRFVVTDTVGLNAGSQGGGIGRKKILEKLAKHIQTHPLSVGGKTDLLLYCLSVHVSSRFNTENPAIMKSLQDVFGKDIWKQCIVVFTFSNTVFERLLKENNNRDAAIEEYREYLTEYANLFQQELATLGNPNMTVIVSLTAEPAPKSNTTLVAVPAGEELDDEVFPIAHANEGAPTHYPWDHTIIVKISNSKCELKERLLQYQYGEETMREILAILAGAGIGGAGFVGVGVGAALGAIIGLVGGPAGASIGVIVGGAVGGAVGVVAGGLAGRSYAKEQD